MYYLPSKDSGWKDHHTWPIGQRRGQKSWKLKLVGREVFPTRFPPDDVEVDNGVASIMSVVDGVIDVDAVDAVYVDNAVGVDNGVDVNNAVDVVLLMLITMPVRILLLRRSSQKLPPDKLVRRMIVVDNQGAPDPDGEVHPEEEIHPGQHFSSMILSQIPRSSRVKEWQRAQMSNAAQALSTSTKHK